VMRKQTKPTFKKRSWYIKKLDDIAKGFAKERDGYICQRSGERVEKSNAHGSHVVPVSAGHTLRWDLKNIKCLSYHNHINWWHKNPTESGEWFKETFPERWEYIQRRRYIKIKISTPDLAALYKAVASCKCWQDYADVYNVHITALILIPLYLY
jgi:hypothetical protein